MRIKDLEPAVIDFCQKEKISIINGTVIPKDAEKIEIFLDTLRRTYKTKKREERMNKMPLSIGEILLTGRVFNARK